MLEHLPHSTVLTLSAFLELGSSVFECLAYNIHQRPNKEGHTGYNHKRHFYNSFSRLISLRIFLLIKIKVMTKTTMSNTSA